MKKLFTIFLFLAMFFLAPLVEANGWLSGYYNRIKIPIDATKVDAALSDFPVPIKLTSANFDFAKANSDGFDFRFTAADGTTLLKYERERHDSANSLAEYWVKVPSISDSADTYIYLYYRTEDTADGADPENVWDSNFKAVHHLKDNTTSAVLDSTSNNNDGTKKGANEPVETAGQIYRAQDFDGTDDYIKILDDGFGVFNLQNFSIECWINPDVLAQTVIWSYDFTEHSAPYYAQHLRIEADGDIAFWWNDGTGFKSLISTSQPLSTGNWYHIVATYASGSQKIYVDGEEVDSSSETGTITYYHQEVYIGESPNFSSFINAKLDEVRISNVARSDAWIKASYHAEDGSLLKSFTNETLYGNFFLMFF